MNQPHILIVDDDVFVTESLTSYLEILGYRVTSVGGCFQAMDELRQKDKIDLVILDYLMPDGSGTDLLRFLAKDATMQRPPVIMSSGIVRPQNTRLGAAAKPAAAVSQSLIQAYVSKPYTLDAMDVALHEVLAGDYIPGPRLTRKNRAAR